MANQNQRLREFREYLNLNQGEMAKKFDKSQTTYSYWEKGGSGLTPEILEKLAGMGLNLNWLATGEGPMLSKDPFLGINLIDLPKRTEIYNPQLKLKASDWREAVEVVGSALRKRGIESRTTDAQKDLLISLFAEGVASGIPPLELQLRLIQLIDLVEAKISQIEHQ